MIIDPNFGGLDPSIFSLFILAIIILCVWELIWKGLALWRAARNKHKVWFVFILIVNSIGILPIIYLLCYRKKRIDVVKPVSKKVK